MSKFYAEPVLCLKDEHRLRPPCRVAAEASSAALPSCQLLQLLPAAWKPAGISGCGRAGRASGAPLLCPAQGKTARRPHLQLLLQHSRLRQQLLGSAGFKFPFLWPVTSPTLVLTPISVPSHLGESVPPRYPDNPSRLALAARAPTNRRLALPASSSIAGIFFIELLSTGIVADHGEHLNTKPDSNSM